MSSQWSLCACLCDNRRLRERRLYESTTAVAVCVSRRLDSLDSVLCVNDRCVIVVDRILFYRDGCVPGFLGCGYYFSFIFVYSSV